MKNKNQKEIDMVIDLQDANILPLDITKRQVKYLINRVNKLKEKGVVIAEGEIDNIRWESPYNKLVFYFKGLPKMIGIKIIKSKKVKIILEEK